MSRGVRSAIVGRAAEFRALDDALDTAIGGQAVTVMVSGDAGVGKTRLFDELAGRARARGCAVLLGSCVETTGSLPYVAVLDALRASRSYPGGLELLRDEVAARPALGRLLPHLLQPAGTDVVTDHSLAQVQLFDGVHGILRKLAETSPLVVIIEDMHGADQSTRDLLAFLDRTLRLTPILTVLHDWLISLARPRPGDRFRPQAASWRRLLHLSRTAKQSN